MANKSDHPLPEYNSLSFPFSQQDHLALAFTLLQKRSSFPKASNFLKSWFVKRALAEAIKILKKESIQ